VGTRGALFQRFFKVDAAYQLFYADRLGGTRRLKRQAFITAFPLLTVCTTDNANFIIGFCLSLPRSDILRIAHRCILH